MCHRVLFGTSGTMANLPLTNPIIAPSHVQHSVVSISFDISFLSLNFVQTHIEGIDAPRNLSLIQYVDSKLPNAHLARSNKTNITSAQALQQYFANQQSKYEIRSTRNAHIFDDKIGNVC